MQKDERLKLMNQYAEQNRQAPNKYEQMFIYKLRYNNMKYGHQQPFVYGHSFIIVDFIFENKKLIIEIDGQTHDDKKDEDAKRDLFLTEKGYKVIRINNRDVELFDMKKIIRYKPKKIIKKKVKPKQKKIKEPKQYQLRYGYID